MHKHTQKHRFAQAFHAFVVLTIVLSALPIVVLFAQQPSTANPAGPYYRVFFRDKGKESSTFSVGTPLYEQTRALHTQRALERRQRVFPDKPVLTLSDAPLYKPYLDSLTATGAALLLRVRWQNYAVVRCDSATAARIARQSFVRAVQQTTSRLYPASTHETATIQAPAASAAFLQCGNLAGALSQQQLSTIAIPELHAMGITGKGVCIGFADAGFRWRTHNAINSARVLAEYDFIFGDSTTSNESSDISGQDAHGTEVFSTVAGLDLKNGFTGAAPQAEFLLAKTEDTRFERVIEQDNFAAALEWMESQGADIISASLGYFTFDTTTVREESYSYSELDGKTTIAARAVNNAAARGVLSLNAAGNDGPRERSIGSPGDADSSFTVAAVRADSVLLPAKFTSRGPRGDGKLKPDIAAQGQNIVCASTSSPTSYQTANGTSLATPLMSGGAALLLSAFPELPPWTIRSLLTSTASQATKPDSALGYGTANVLAAMLKYDIIITPEIAYYPVYRAMRVVAGVRSSLAALNVTLFVRFKGSTDFRSYPMKSSVAPYLYETDVALDVFGGQAAECYVVAEDSRGKRRMPFFQSSLSSSLNITPLAVQIPCGITTNRLSFTFAEQGITEGVRPSPIAQGATGTLMLFTPDAGMLSLAIYSVLGQQVYADATQVQTGLSNITFPTNQLPSGVYMIKTVHNGAVRVFPFIVNQ